MFALDRPLGRRAFLLAGLALVALKVALDLGVTRAFGQPFSLSFYVIPDGAPVFSPPQVGPSGVVGPSATAYWLTVVGCAMPFVAVGVALTIRRLRDAGMPGYLVLFFFVPFLKFLFFAALAMAPSRRVAETFVHDAGPFRSATIDLGPEENESTSGKRRVLALAAGILAGDGVALAAMGLSVGLLKEYGWPLMVATPAVAGFVATTVYARLWRPTGSGAVLVTVLTFVIGMSFLSAAALEGFGCILMMSPLFLGEALLGSYLAWAFARVMIQTPYASASLGSSLVILPLAFAAHGASPLPPEASLPIESVVVVHAPPEVVWKRVIAFPPLAPPTEMLFRAGIAAPLRATIDGEGVGAVRKCEFTTGTFVEPIEVWKPGRELSFSVTSQPDPMREWTLYAGVRPPHLDGYLESTRGQFVLEPMADGGTRLIGRTWYRMRMEPEGYWRLWGDAVIHAIHLRVLRHVAQLAEEDVKSAAR